MSMAAPFEPERIQRQKAVVTQRANQTAQQGRDAMTRRFAALGGLNSGAAIKALERADNTANEQREAGLAEIDAREGQNQFAAEEADKVRAFQGNQAAIDRAMQQKAFDFQTGAQFNLQKDQLRLAQEESAFNRRMARHQMENSGGLLGGGGFLGTGIGKKSAKFAGLAGFLGSKV
jgi:hypothetical protein